MKLPGIQYQDNLKGLAKRNINAPLQVAGAQAAAAGAQASAAGAQAGAAGKEAQAARAMSSLYRNVADSVTQVEDYFLEQEATRQVQEAQSRQKIALTELSEAQDRVDPETGEAAWKSTDNYKEKISDITDSVTTDMNPRARAAFDPWAENANTANYLGQIKRADGWRREDNKLQSYKTMDTQEKSNLWVEAKGTNDLALQQQTISPNEHWKNEMRINAGSTMYTYENTAKAYVVGGNVEALTQEKEEIMQDTTLTMAQRKSTVAKVEEIQMNNTLDNFHNIIQAEEKTTNLDVAVAKGEEYLSKLLRADSEVLGGDDKYKVGLHTKLTTELNRYKKELYLRDDAGSKAVKVLAPTQMAYGHSDSAAKNSNAKVIAAMTDVEGNTMSRKDFLGNAKIPHGNGQTNIQEYVAIEAAQTGLVNKESVNIIEAGVNQDEATQVQAIETVIRIQSKIGKRGNKTISQSDFSDKVMDRVALANAADPQTAAKLTTTFENQPPGYMKQFNNEESRKTFKDAWDDNAETIVGDVFKEEGFLFDTALGMGNMQMNEMKMLAEKFYPITRDPDLAMKAAANAMLNSGKYTSDYTTGAAKTKPKEQSATNVEGFDLLSKDDQTQVGEIVLADLTTANGGEPINMDRVTYNTAPGSNPNAPIMSVTYMGAAGFEQNTQIKIDKNQLDDARTAMEKQRIREAEVERNAQHQMNLDGATEAQQAGRVLTRAQRNAMTIEAGKNEQTASEFFGGQVKGFKEYMSYRLDGVFSFPSDVLSLPGQAMDEYREWSVNREKTNNAPK